MIAGMDEAAILQALQLDDKTSTPLVIGPSYR